MGVLILSFEFYSLDFERGSICHYYVRAILDVIWKLCLMLVSYESNPVL